MVLEMVVEAGRRSSAAGWRRVILRTLVASSIAAVLAVPMFAARSIRPFSQALLPAVGAELHTDVGRHFPDGGTLLVVSETCEICLQRAESYVKAVARRPDHVLLVAAAPPSTVFEPLLDSYPNARVVFMEPEKMMTASRVRAVPTTVAIDPGGIVREARASNIGWVGAAFSPESWLDWWRRTLTRSDDQ